MERENAWKHYSAEQLEELEAFAADYRAYLNNGKTERECVTESVKLAKKAGFKDLSKLIASGKALKPGDRVYRDWMGKSLLCYIVGKKPMEKGMNILGAHIDSPRMDVKQNPLYEDSDLCYLDTHYYGGIKKYQWVARELALHGVVTLKSGKVIPIAIGEKEDDPVFLVSDLLIHLSGEQMEKTARKVIEGENLDIIVGSKPLEGEEKDAVKAGVLAILKQQYGFEEEDFLSAEIEAVPAGKARDAGFDRGLISGYGHDDRVCSFPSLRAMLDYKGTPEYTLCCVLTDKEEIGSYGATGMHSMYFENTTAEVYNLIGGYSELNLRRALQNSRMLSSDVSAGYDPLFASSFEKKNVGYLGRGMCFNKYTGSGGKGGSSDANAEYVAEVRRIMDAADVKFQLCELGRVDAGGGGTIAHMCAAYGMNVIDAGVAVLSMHAPAELISKADLFEAYRGYLAFLDGAKEI